MKAYAFGVDVGGTTVKLGLFTAEGELLDKWEIPTRTENAGYRRVHSEKDDGTSHCGTRRRRHWHRCSRTCGRRFHGA